MLRNFNARRTNRQFISTAQFHVVNLLPEIIVFFNSFCNGSEKEFDALQNEGISHSK